MSDGSSYSGDSDSSNEGFLEEMFNHFDAEVGIMPYQFEPEIKVASDTEDSEDAEDSVFLSISSYLQPPFSF